MLSRTFAKQGWSSTLGKWNCCKAGIELGLPAVCFPCKEETSCFPHVSRMRKDEDGIDRADEPLWGLQWGLQTANTFCDQRNIYAVGANQSHYLVRYRLWLFKPFQEWNWLLQKQWKDIRCKAVCTLRVRPLSAAIYRAPVEPWSEKQEIF